ncbi:hypothetical protein AGMMS49983_21530 [Clostridia bacterium]|nr:hypothetical protein AGMMS49983_21530 [Clostridia bacterium]
MALTARIEVEKEQELRRINHEKLQVAMDVEILNRITKNIVNGKEKLTSHEDVMREIRAKGYNV